MNSGRSANSNKDDPPHQSFPFGEKVLVVEDSFLVAKLIEETLSDNGYLVAAITATADDAVGACERLQPNFVIMDISLVGERDGISAATEIYKRFGIRSIFLTANSATETQERASPANPIGWISKPVTSELLVRRLNAMSALG